MWARVTNSRAQIPCFRKSFLSVRLMANRFNVASLPKSGVTLFEGIKSDSTWVFENKDHDFPSRIQYQIEADSAFTDIVVCERRACPSRRAFISACANEVVRGRFVFHQTCKHLNHRRWYSRFPSLAPYPLSIRIHEHRS